MRGLDGERMGCGRGEATEILPPAGGEGAEGHAALPLRHAAAEHPGWADAVELPAARLTPASSMPTITTSRHSRGCLR